MAQGEIVLINHLVKNWNKDYLLGYCKKIITVKLGQVSLGARDEVRLLLLQQPSVCCCCFCSSPLGFTDQKWSKRSVSVFLLFPAGLRRPVGRPVPCARVSSASATATASCKKIKPTHFCLTTPCVDSMGKTMGSFLFRKPRLSLMLATCLLLQALSACGFVVVCPYWI